VSELVSGLLGKFSYSVTWMFAAATVTGTGWLLASPAAARLRLAPYFARLNAVTGALVFAGIVTALGFTMAAVARPLY
jgi:predicted ABC-type sugar transport system permease subunit